MNHLTAYTDTDQLNQLIGNDLEAGRPGGLKENLYLGNEVTLGLTTNNLTLLSSQQYPYTALGPIGLVKLRDQPQPSVVTQILNRHTVNPTNRSASQLVLLDTQAQTEIEQALRRDARHTGGTTVAHSLFDSADQDVQWILTHRFETLAAITDVQQYRWVRPNATEAWGHYQALGKDPPTREAVRGWLYGQDHSVGWGRFKRNDTKSGNRLSSHYTNLGAGLDIEQARTAARGEYAASKLLITAYGPNYQMKMGKSVGGGRPNGIDQIWVKRDMQTGNVLEYLIIEAKGSVNATLGHPGTGQQMSPRWLFWCLVRMAAGHGSYIDAQTSRELPKKILTSLINHNGIPVRGVVFHSLYGSQNESKVVEMTDLGLYSFVTAFENATAGVQRFHSAPTQEFIAFQ
ncbi:hypothetical protein M3A49_21685 [Paraburkholderia sp. CNPSo 3076]|uniref:hypothetical protein n=1 Tax=Paraburkholderia sp. CNPSo 3076 TaxID=2940936 RepID=UPI00225BBDF2|nr:hypothetical protein [Paraburkholderia sp. CNPSo 3076]MCX5542090.1 hypothetical protein [Paraburkholderia sp. CNPSo 3076]